jgi:hypothetical protein
MIDRKKLGKAFRLMRKHGLPYRISGVVSLLA